ncbi:MAG TPA: hypothetical protein VJ653_04170 [Acidimicrobiales bacterium]|nr:hypothetical protein [Acidimicrobiales bacterium]
MTTHQVTYRGPSIFAVRAAALLADAAGVELTSATKVDTPADTAELAMTVEGTDEAVVAAVEAVRAELPAGATLD